MSDARRRALALMVVVLAVSSSLATAGLARSGDRFIDDDGNVHELDIEAVAAAGITRGCNPPDNDRYCPELPVLRGQMAAFLVRALDLPVGTGDPFTDDDSSVFQNDIEALAAAGVTRGCNPPDNDRFCPDDPVTRGQMAAFLDRALDLGETPSGDRFIDDDGNPFEVSIERLAAAGITRGCNPPTNDRFCPTEVVRRDQMASFLARALGLVGTPPSTTSSTGLISPTTEVPPPPA